MKALVLPDLQEALGRFEAALSELLRSEVLFVELIHQDLVAAGGKRIRPQLVFLASRAIGGAPFEMELALAVELLHSATLLHDDLIDDAETRRGKEAAFRRYGNAVSVLSGDFLLSRLLHVIARTGRMELVERFAEVAKALSEGEVLQFQVAALEDYSLENYEKIITAKTAVLMRLACEGVAVLKGVDGEVQEALGRFGLRYGQAFQMRDDYLDLMGDPKALGKPIGGDVREGKLTLLTLKLLERFPEEVGPILRRRAREAQDLERLRALARETGVAQEVEAAIGKRVEEAVEALSPLPDTPYRRALEALARAEGVRLA